jgi:hypothetical protein
MAFVPEGQADSSQVRSAWVAMPRGPVPEYLFSVIGRIAADFSAEFYF